MENPSKGSMSIAGIVVLAAAITLVSIFGAVVASVVF